MTAQGLTAKCADQTDASVSPSKPEICRGYKQRLLIGFTHQTYALLTVHLHREAVSQLPRARE